MIENTSFCLLNGWTNARLIDISLKLVGWGIEIEQIFQSCIMIIHRGSYMSKGKRDKMRGFSSILSLFRYKFYKFNNTRAGILDSIYHMTLRIL